MSRPSPLRGWKLVENPRGVEFTVLGEPKPKGSMQGFVVGGRAIVTEKQRSGSRTWQRLIANEAQRHAPAGGPLDGPLVASIRFFMLRPVSQPKCWLTLPDRKPDLDKLVRAVLDALSKVIIADDARIVLFRELGKFYSLRPRVEIGVWEARPEDLPLVSIAAAEIFYRKEGQAHA